MLQSLFILYVQVKAYQNILKLTGLHLGQIPSGKQVGAQNRKRSNVGT